MNRQNGVAIISVLLTVALASIIVSGLFLREHITVRSVENRLALTQVRWIERAAVDWSKVILTADLSSTKEDHLGEPWAIPVLDTRLDETVTAGAKIDDEARAATLSGQMTDAQSLFNLNNLVDASGGTLTLSVININVFKRLLDLLGLPQAIADTVASRVMAYKQPTGAKSSVPGSNANTGTSAGAAQPTGNQSSAENAATAAVNQTKSKEPLEVLPMLRLSDLMAVRGINAEALELLEGFVIFLPEENTKINVGTAPAEILAALGEIGLEEARRLVTERERVYWRKTDDFTKSLTGEANKNAKALSVVNSNYFLVRGLIRFGRVESLTETLLRRSKNPKKVDVIWQRRI